MKGFAIIFGLANLRQACALPFGVYPNIEDRSDIEDWTHVPRYEKTALSPEELAARMEEWHAPMVTHNIAATWHARGCTPARAARNVSSHRSWQRNLARTRRAGPRQHAPSFDTAARRCNLLRMTYDRAYWEQLWAKTLREHPNKSRSVRRMRT